MGTVLSRRPLDYIHYNRGVTHPISDKLLAWYGEHARDLPWRRSRDPYAIWVAEIMLQQTRVEAALPYYRAFMDRFPTVQALAAASQQEVLRLWEGMGYYARARNLHRAAQIVVEQHGGQLPSDRAQLMALPGVGEYTASALRSFAFGADELALEGNLRRVLARLFEMQLDPRSPSGERELRRLGESILPRGRSSQFNQALMDLGAGICTPRSPRCDQCPLRENCLAYRHGTQQQLPRRAERAELPLRQAAAAIWMQDGKVLLRRQPPEGLLGGLWGFPGDYLESEETPADALQRTLEQQLGARLLDHTPLLPLQHSFTHFHLRLYPFRCQAESGGRRLAENADLRWVPVEQLDRYPMGKLDRHLASGLD